jgi:16S rRNA (uracil1498-N3)-methyltransferase
MRTGDRATVFNGQGAEAEVELTVSPKGKVDLRMLATTKTIPLPAQVTLAQAVPKGKTMELIVEKATELGVHRIAPLLSERVVVRAGDEDAARKQAKWQRVAVEACKQSGQNWLPEVSRPVTPRDFFEQPGQWDMMLIASLQPGSRPLKVLLAEVAPKRPGSVLVLVGPEGDFTPAETALAQSRGCRPLTLGPIILRTETAALYCLSVLAHELYMPVA